MIKAVIFDAGGVYVKGSLTNFVNRAYKIVGIKKRFYKKEELMFDSELTKGLITLEQSFRRHFKKEISNEEMKKLFDLWIKNWQPFRSMIELVKKLKKHYKIAILSNSEVKYMEYYRKKGSFRLFNVLILSHKLGIAKPNVKIYKITLKRLKLKPGECVFIDDHKENLEPAKKLGMEIILFRSLSQLKKDLKKKGIIIDK